MGCTSSQVPDPNAQFGKNTVTPHPNVRNGDVRKGSSDTSRQNGHMFIGDNSFATITTTLTANGEAVNGEPNEKASDTASENTSTFSVTKRDEPSRTLRGDLSQRQEARMSREMKLKDIHKIREEKAMRISELVMEEKERLSLSTMSRSRATSRTGSPRLHRGDSMRPCTSTQIEPSFSSPPPKSGSEESLRSKPDEPLRQSALKSANGRRRKGESKVRIITDDMNQSQRASATSNATANATENQRKGAASNSNVDHINNNNINENNSSGNLL